jgi:hypothetical protein
MTDIERVLLRVFLQYGATRIPMSVWGYDAEDREGHEILWAGQGGKYLEYTKCDPDANEGRIYIWNLADLTPYSLEIIKRLGQDETN